MENKNAVLTFSFYPEHYPNINLTFNCDEDLEFSTLVDYFRRFALAMTYSSKTIDEYLGEEN